MLSLSAEISQQNVDLHVVNGDGDGGVLFGAELARFAGALVSGDEPTRSDARAALLQAAGEHVLVDAAAVAANFQRMVRIADSTGIPVDGIMLSMSGNIQNTLNLRRFESARNTPQRSRFEQWSGRVVRKLAPMLLGRMKKR